MRKNIFIDNEFIENCFSAKELFRYAVRQVSMGVFTLIFLGASSLFFYCVFPYWYEDYVVYDPFFWAVIKALLTTLLMPPSFLPQVYLVFFLSKASREVGNMSHYVSYLSKFQQWKIWKMHGIYFILLMNTIAFLVSFFTNAELFVRIILSVYYGLTVALSAYAMVRMMYASDINTLNEIRENMLPADSRDIYKYVGVMRKEEIKHNLQRIMFTDGWMLVFIEDGPGLWKDSYFKEEGITIGQV